MVAKKGLRPAEAPRSEALAYMREFLPNQFSSSYYATVSADEQSSEDYRNRQANKYQL